MKTQETERQDEMIGNTWDQVLKDQFDQEYFQNLRKFLNKEYEEKQIFPEKKDIFAAFKATDYQDVKVVILGQDPYHGEGQSHGFAFSVKPGIKQPPSLVNIFKELEQDLGIPRPEKDYGCLLKWADQGVLLLNTVLTVEAHKANSHKKKGWETFTDAVISSLAAREKPMVFILWGNNAKSKIPLIEGRGHLILTGSHPSPLSAHTGFYGGHYFSKTNEFLEKTGQAPIDWDIRQ